MAPCSGMAGTPGEAAEMLRPGTPAKGWAVLLLLAALGGQCAVVAPDPASLLRQKRVLLIQPTYPTDYHAGPRRIATGKINRVAAAVGLSGLTAIQGVDTMTLATLNLYDIVIFNYFTKLELLEKTPFGIAFKAWLASGNRGWIGNHNTGSQSLGEWNWFRDSVQSMRYIDHKGQSQKGSIRITADAAVRKLPVLEGMDAQFTGEDEWYSFDMPPKAPAAPTWGDCQPLYYLDESSVASLADRMGADHPVAWVREDARGNRFFYSTLIHSESGADSDFYHSLLLRAMEYVAGYAESPDGVRVPFARRPDAASHRSTQPWTEILVGGRFRLSFRTAEGKGPHSLIGRTESRTLGK